MTTERPFRFTLELFLVPLALVLSIWTVYWLEINMGISLNEYGIYPRKLSGLRGIVCAPFIHGSVSHLYNNTFPLAILSLALGAFYGRSSLKVFLLGILFSGMLTWLIGRSSYHIGVSGLIYVLVSFIFFKGVLSKHYRLIALSLTVVFIYGSMIWYIFPVEEEISWEGHLSGFLTGLILAIFLKAPTPKVHKYDWESDTYNESEDEFLKCFDENGNFIEKVAEEKKVDIIYHYKKEESND